MLCYCTSFVVDASKVDMKTRVVLVFRAYHFVPPNAVPWFTETSPINADPFDACMLRISDPLCKLDLLRSRFILNSSI